MNDQLPNGWFLDRLGHSYCYSCATREVRENTSEEIDDLMRQAIYGDRADINEATNTLLDLLRVQGEFSPPSSRRGTKGNPGATAKKHQGKEMIP